MNRRKALNKVRARRAARSRARVLGTDARPRLAVFRSNRHIYAQLIDDKSGRTLASASSRGTADKKISKTDAAFAAGGLLAKKSSDLGIKSAVFDRRSRKYHGRVKAVAEGARKAGLRL